MPKTRVFAYLDGCGNIATAEENIPPLLPGMVQVEVKNSLISPGTELSGGWRSLQAQSDSPSPVAKPQSFGYSNTGIVAAVGEGVTRFQAGDRVACIGAGFAQHATVAVVPHNLCFPLPEAVSFAAGAYAMLAGTALHALRRTAPEFGEYIGIAGLGLVGQLAAQLCRLNGAFVMGWDMIEKRTQLADSLGIDATATVGAQDEIALTKSFTGQAGLDGLILAIAGKADRAMKSIQQVMKCSPDTHLMGRITIVGGVTFTYESEPVRNLDLRHSGRTGAGYHDDKWETGDDYPAVFMRWTTRTNLELCLRLMAEKRLQVAPLTTHTIPLAAIKDGVAELIKSPDDALGVVIEM